MTVDFDFWIRSLYPPGQEDPGGYSVGAIDILRATFDSRGALDRSEVDEVFETVAMQLAHDAVALFMADVARTSSLDPSIEVYRNETGTIVVSWDGNYTTPVFDAMRDPEATCEVADNLQDRAVGDLSAAWPLCPTHAFGLHPDQISGLATWFCRYGDHVVSAIGQLPGDAGARRGVKSTRPGTAKPDR